MPDSIPRLSEAPPESRPYQPYGAALALLGDRRPEIVLSGPAGTGKSRACLEKLHLCAERYPGMRALMLRKTRKSLTDAALVTFEDKVLPAGHGALQGARREQRHAYRYPNGSEIVIGGLDNAGKVMSTEYDIIYIQEAIETAEDDWEKATTRLRNGVLPYQQLIADTNPDAPSHWLKKRCERNQCVMLESRHEDNPTVTPEYLARLDALTGVRYHRLRHGRWVAAEGMVYEGWDAAIHRVDWFEPPNDWARLWVVDFGYTNPFVWQAWAIDGDGRLWRYREVYQTGMLVEDLASIILDLTREEPRPQAIICDHDAEGRATLERHLGMGTTAAFKDVQPGIQAVQARLRVAGDGKARLFLMRDALAQRDAALEERRAPTGTEEEFDGYVWNTAAKGQAAAKKVEEPVKKDDHGLDALRYLVAYADNLRGTYSAPVARLGAPRRR